MNPKKSLYGLILLLSSNLFTGCANHDIDPWISDDYFVFGSYYGMCVGNCVNFFVVNNGSLYKVNQNRYPNQQKPYEIDDLIKLEQEKYDLVKDLLLKMPTKLLTESQTIIGCPDCADGGGTYLEIRQNGEKKFWYLDNSKYETPAYLHEYIDEVNSKIRLLWD